MPRSTLSQARVYIDTCIFLNVIKRESELWPDSLKLLLAAERGDVHLIASTMLMVEVGSFKGDLDLAVRDTVISKYLEGLKVEWAEVDLFTAAEARRLGDQYRMRGADALHLATAVRRKADYFVSRDNGFPYGQTIGKTQVVRPFTLWNPTIDDALIDADAAEESQAARKATEAAQQMKTLAAAGSSIVDRPKRPMKSAKRPPKTHS